MLGKPPVQSQAPPGTSLHIFDAWEFLIRAPSPHGGWTQLFAQKAPCVLSEAERLKEIYRGTGVAAVAVGTTAAKSSVKRQIQSPQQSSKTLERLRTHTLPVWTTQLRHTWPYNVGILIVTMSL